MTFASAIPNVVTDTDHDLLLKWCYALSLTAATPRAPAIEDTDHTLWFKIASMLYS